MTLQGIPIPSSAPRKWLEGRSVLDAYEGLAPVLADLEDARWGADSRRILLMGPVWRGAIEALLNPACEVTLYGGPDELIAELAPVLAQRRVSLQFWKELPGKCDTQSIGYFDWIIDVCWSQECTPEKYKQIVPTLQNLMRPFGRWLVLWINSLQGSAGSVPFHALSYLTSLGTPSVRYGMWGVQDSALVMWYAMDVAPGRAT